MLLAIFVGAATLAARRVAALPSWVVWIGLLTVVTLIVGGMAFLTDSDVLTAFLDVSLLLLLVWVVATSVAMLRTRAPQAVNRAAG